MRILIADDLPLQVRELSDGIRSVWPDWEILTADNGQSVVEAVSAAPVDVVLSDIRMPRMDGLEMLSVVREISPKTKIVFITAYPLFEYAQQALKLGASDFLLKPVDMLALYDTLSRLTSEGEEPALGEELKICLTEDFRRLSAPMQKRIRGCLTEGCVCALSFPTSRKLPQPRYLAAEIGSRAGCSVVAAEMHAGAETRRYALVCSAGEWDSRTFVREVRTASMRFGFRFGTSQWSAKLPENGRALWKDALRAEQLAFYNLRGASSNPGGGALSLPELPTVQSLMTWFGSNEGWRAPMERLLASICDAQPDADDLVRGTMQLLRGCGQLIAGGDEEDAAKAAQLGHEMRYVLFFSEYRACLERGLTELEALYRRSLERSDPVEMAIAYVRRHYMEPITLAEVAQKIHLSPNYFSALFRRRTSLRFMEYVLQVRMEKASEMLANTQMHIYEIAAACGYENVGYFIRVYQKTHGVTPASFRRCFSRGGSGREE